MELRDRGSARSLRLTPVDYEFPAEDDSWLVIEGVVNGVDREWTFRDPALTAREVAVLIAWLRAAADGRVKTTPRDAAKEPSLDFVEPVLGFSIVGQSEVDLTLRAYLRYEAAPPHTFHEAITSEGRPYISKTDSSFFLDMTLRRENVLRASSQLESESRPFPLRASEY